MTITLVSFSTKDPPILRADIRLNGLPDIGTPHCETTATIRLCRKRVFLFLTKKSQQRAIVFFVFGSTAISVGFICIRVKSNIGWNSHVPCDNKRLKQ